MHALADSGHERAAELREKAHAFDVTTAGVYAGTPTHTVAQLMGTWASPSETRGAGRRPVSVTGATRAVLVDRAAKDCETPSLPSPLQ
jgi:hypothetical protein